MRSHRKMRGGGGKITSNVIFIIITAFLVMVLGYLLYQSNSQDEKLAQEIEEQNRLDMLAKKEEEERLNGIVEHINAVQQATLPGVICWGDSLTAGAGGGGVKYPDVLGEQIKSNIFAEFDIRSLKNPEILNFNTDIESYALSVPAVLNMGVGGETTNTILGRNGGIPFVVADDFVIPADKTSVSITFMSENGKDVAPLRQGKAGMEYVIISGVKGIIKINQESSKSKDYSYTFTRFDAGESVNVKAGTKIETEGSAKGLDYLTVIFIGQNGGYADIPELISQQRAVLWNKTGNRDKFIIVGLHTGTAESRAELEKAMIAEYGNKYINLREYMSTQALSDAGIEATAEDKERMNKGSTPSSLLSDSIHFNSVGYELIGKLIYRRMDELGYFNEVKEAIQSAGK